MPFPMGDDHASDEPRRHPLAAYYQDILPPRPCDPRADDLLRNLLAFVHQDGGQDAKEYGLAESCCRAEVVIRQLRLDAIAVRERRNEALEELSALIRLIEVS